MEQGDTIIEQLFTIETVLSFPPPSSETEPL